MLLRMLPGAVWERGTSGMLPLHMACRWSCDIEMIRCLHDAGPAAILTQDSDGNLPLHAAALNNDINIPVEVAELYGPSALRAMNSKNRVGETPAHLACESISSAAVILQLIRINPGLLCDCGAMWP